MIAAMHKSMVAKRDRLAGEQGFTLIELLVVILIIGVLAAIAIPVFIGQQALAEDAASKANLANAKIAYTAYLVENPGSSPTPVQLGTYGFPQDNSVTIVTAGASFCLTAGDWEVTATGAMEEGDCT